jgi:hypothetical protein
MLAYSCSCPTCDSWASVTRSSERVRGMLDRASYLACRCEASPQVSEGVRQTVRGAWLLIQAGRFRQFKCGGADERGSHPERAQLLVECSECHGGRVAAAACEAQPLQLRTERRGAVEGRTEAGGMREAS